MDEQKIDVVAEDESVLDKELNESIETIKAGNTPEPAAPAKPEEKAG